MHKTSAATIGDFQLWIHNQRRAAKTEAEELGWIDLDAWVFIRVMNLRERTRQRSVESFPLYRLIEDRADG